MVENFLIDSNSFITPFRQYYAFDLAPSYWDQLSRAASTGRIILLDMVKAELEQGGDELADWVKKTNFQVCKHAAQDIIIKYAQIMQYVKDCGLYKPSAFQAWAPANIADPWIIAASCVKDYTIITAEVPSGGLKKNTPNKSAKIPDVAKQFNARCNNIYYMMRQLGITM
ncbi:MAG: DUF4411 family protein [Eubacteriales bacterium]|nr:DUF4411 family protein [Eubacteriales bacterium]